jgi:hypothetical protein
LCAIAMLSLAVTTAATIRPAYADGAPALASQLSDHAFALLDVVNADSSKGAPILAPVASLAGDAQALSTALGAGDRAAASRAMASIVNDRDQIDAAAKSAHGMNPGQWEAIKGQIAALEKLLPPAAGAAAARATGAPSSARAPAPSTSVAPPTAERLPSPPKVAIASRVFKAGSVHVKGYLEGTELKSAGIFDGDEKSKDIEVASTPGEQRINFDFSIEQPSPTQSIRVSDAYGREAHAMIAPDPAGVGAMKGSEVLIEVDPSAASSSGVANSSSSTDEGRLASSGPAVRHNTAEIPRSGDALSPSHRHINSGRSLAPLANVQISIIDAEELMSAPGVVEVIGQISGAGVKRAGVYVNGRLAEPIPISASGYSGFDVRYAMPAGSDARIRAYGNGNDFVEASIDTVSGGGGMTAYSNPPMYAAPGVYPSTPYYGTNPYAYENPYARNPYPYGYAPSPYGSPPPYGYPPQPPPSGSIWNRLFH